MDDLNKLADFSKQENNYILQVFLDPGSGEDAMRLAHRNVRATASSFGEETALHAMALNTLAFCLFHSNKDGLRQPIEESLADASKSEAILKKLGVDTADTDFLHATSRLQVMLARMFLEDHVAAVEAFLLLPFDQSNKKTRTERAVRGLVAYMDTLENAENRNIAVATLKIAATVLQSTAAKLVFSSAKGDLAAGLARFNQRFYS